MPKGIKKNNRPSLVCYNCRRRKIKCDRKTPCTRCVKANLVETCSYDSTIYLNGLLCDDLSNDVTSENEFTGDSYTRADSELFNFASLEFKKPLFIKDGETSSYLSPITVDAIFSNNEQFVRFKSMIPNLFTSQEKSKYSKDLQNTSEKELQQLYGIYTESEMVELINQYITPNLNAIVERIDCFNGEIKTGCIYLPVSNMIKSFKSFFVKDFKNTDNYILCRTPIKSDFAIFATIIGIVRVISATTEYDNNARFHYQLNMDRSIMSKIAIKSLSFADYRGRPTFNLMLGFLTNRLFYFILDAVTVNSNADIFFNISLEIAFKLGIHIRCDQIEDYTEDEVIGVWNVLQFIDAISSIHLGTILKVDYRHCVPRLYNYWEPIILYFRKLSLTFISIYPISINTIIDLSDSAAKLLSIFRPYDELLNSQPAGPANYLFSIVMKSDFVICYQLLLLLLRLSIDDVSKLPIKCNKRDLELISEIKEKAECQLFYSLILTFSLIKNISNGKISHYTQSMQLTVSLRLLFSKFMKIGNKLLFFYLSTSNGLTSNPYVPNFDGSGFTVDTHEFGDISLREAESYLSLDFDSINIQDRQTQKMRHMKSSLPGLCKFLMEFYTSVSSTNSLIKTGKFIIHFKFLLFICILLKNAYIHREYCSTVNVNFHFKYEDWKHVIEKTTQHFTGNFEDFSTNNKFHNELRLLSPEWEFMEQNDMIETLNYSDGNCDSDLDGIYNQFFG